MLLFLVLTAWLMASGPVAYGASKKPQEDPNALLAKASPFYDFSSPELKPWHLKISYELYDEEGKPSEQGTFEYWWASPKVYRSTWTRPGATLSRWHTANGMHATKSSGERLSFFEKNLASDLISPLPQTITPDSIKMALTFKTINVGKFVLPCIAQGPDNAGRMIAPDVQAIFATTYCFDERSNALLVKYSYGVITTEFSEIKKVQGRYLPFMITIFGGEQKRFSATVKEVEGISPTDPNLEPPKDSLVADVPRVALSEAVTRGAIVQKTKPEYPLPAKMENLQGAVLLSVLIGTDGKVRDIEVISSPSPLLTDSAVKAVSHWEYKPYLLGGKPVETFTTIEIFFSLRR